MGEVLIGMPGPWAKDNLEEADHYTTKIGGIPDWPIPEVDIPAKFLDCHACGSCLCLVMQLYAPLSSDNLMIEERTIYVFGCTVQKCGNNPLSWRVLRVQKSNCEEPTSKDEHSSVETPSVPEFSNKWLEDIWTDSPFGDDIDNEGVNLEELGKALSEAANLVSHSRKKNSHQQHEVKMALPIKLVARSTDTKKPVVPCFYTYCQKESSSENVSTASSNNSSFSMKDRECDLDNARGDETWEEEGYEYDKALFVDRTFLKFKKRLDAYPEQCFRYSYSGKPLLSSKELEIPPKCEFCGAFKQYEVQLMPPLLHFLREASDDSSTHSPHCWEWMTLIVYTCSKNCSHTTGGDGNSSSGWTVAEETVIVQYE